MHGHMNTQTHMLTHTYTYIQSCLLEQQQETLIIYNEIAHSFVQFFYNEQTKSDIHIIVYCLPVLLSDLGREYNFVNRIRQHLSGFSVHPETQLGRLICFYFTLFRKFVGSHRLKPKWLPPLYIYIPGTEWRSPVYIVCIWLTDNPVYIVTFVVWLF
jgi:hypothetical protein